jgi:hypothetical protein
VAAAPPLATLRTSGRGVVLPGPEVVDVSHPSWTGTYREQSHRAPVHPCRTAPSVSPWNRQGTATRRRPEYSKTRSWLLDRGPQITRIALELLAVPFDLPVEQGPQFVLQRHKKFVPHGSKRRFRFWIFSMALLLKSLTAYYRILPSLPSTAAFTSAPRVRPA